MYINVLQSCKSSYNQVGTQHRLKVGYLAPSNLDLIAMCSFVVESISGVIPPR